MKLYYLGMMGFDAEESDGNLFVPRGVEEGTANAATAVSGIVAGLQTTCRDTAGGRENIHQE